MKWLNFFRFVLLLAGKKQEVAMLKIGTKLPRFDLKSSSGGRLTETDLVGRFAVIVFYPKNNTPG